MRCNERERREKMSVGKGNLKTQMHERRKGTSQRVSGESREKTDE